MSLPKPSDKLRFAARCSILRHRLGLTQEKFAERLDVSAMTVSRWELAQVMPRNRQMGAFEQVEAEYNKRVEGI